MKSLKESIFDDFEKISNDADAVLALDKMYKNWEMEYHLQTLKNVLIHWVEN